MNANQATRQRILIAVALGILAVYAVLSLLDARKTQHLLGEVRADLVEVKGKLADIDRLKRAPKVAALQLESPAEITNRIAAALQAAGLSKSNLLKEEPLDPQRIQRTDFDQRTTTIELTPTTIPQILQFCAALRDEETGSIVRDIRLSSPQGGAVGGDEEEWEVELVLTQMIFSRKADKAEKPIAAFATAPAEGETPASAVSRSRWIGAAPGPRILCTARVGPLFRTLERKGKEIRRFRENAIHG